MSRQDELIRRIRGEYREMPGLSLTPAQATRLWQIDHATCELILERLMTERFLTRTPSGRFVALPSEQPIRIDLPRRPLTAAS